jgi:hypothetical protein
VRDGRGAPARGRARVPGGTWRRARAQTSGPSQDVTLASSVVGLRTFRTAQLLRETARAASAGIGMRTLASALFFAVQKSPKFARLVSSTGKKTPGGAGTHTGHKDTRITQTNLTSAIQTHQRTTPVTTPEAEPTDPRPTHRYRSRDEISAYSRLLGLGALWKTCKLPRIDAWAVASSTQRIGGFSWSNLTVRKTTLITLWRLRL